MEPAPDDALMQRVEELYEKTRHVEAWSLLAGLAPPETWTNAKWQVRAAKIMDRVGAPTRSRRLVFKLWHHRPSRPAAREMMFWQVADLRGPLRAWQWLQAHPPGPDTSEEEQASHSAYRAYALGELRDFKRAECELGEALRQDPGEAWFHTVKSRRLAKQDRHADALAAAQEAMRLDPDFVSPVGAALDALLALGRDDEALALLREALTHIESGSLAANLANLEIELELHAEATRSLDLYERLLPLMEPEARNWLHARRCDLACHAGDYDAAREWAKKITDSGFYKSVAARLGNVRTGLASKSLPVGFVRQHHLTCAPATLAMLCRYWGSEVEHVALAEEICHDGTPHHLERRWADEHGFATREFSVTVEATKQLIDAGIPFTFSTVYPGGAHCQAVTGYDEFRHVLLIRDPDQRAKSEFLAEEGLKAMAFCGPRGMAMVPRGRADELEALPLPDAELYDGLHQTNLALVRHDREAAAKHVEKLSFTAPDHRLMWQAKWALSAYDGDPAAVLEAVEALCRLHPENVNWQMERIARMTTVRSTEERLAALRELCAGKPSDPLLWRMLARELHTDARHLPEARRWLTKVNRVRHDAVAWITSANLLWDEQRREEATGIYRLAACWDDKDEALASSYFRATRWQKQPDTGIEFLRDRAARMGRTSGLPARTLHEALGELDRWDEAFQALEESLRVRPDDTGQMLFVARTSANFGRVARARELLSAAKGKGRPSEWHRAHAQLAQRDGNAEEELREWEQVLKDEPMAMDAHRAIAALHEQTRGAQAALRYLRAQCAARPHHWPLHEMLLGWARDDGPAAWENVARSLIRIQPHNAWARRELALALEALKRFDEASVELDVSEMLDPRSAALHYLRGSLARSSGRMDDACRAFRRALELDVDHTHALRELVQCTESPERRLEALRFIQMQITRQTTNGESVSAFADCARPYLPPTTLQQFLEEAHKERPDLWQTWAALGGHLRDHDQAEAAVTLFQNGVDRFPLMPRMWMELAQAHAVKPDRARQVEALEKVREINPAWGQGMRNLADALELMGRFADARTVLEQSVRFSSLDALNHGWLAERQWAAGLREEALQHVTEAVRLEPGYGWAWDRLIEWGATLERPETGRSAVDRLIAQRPMEPRTWMRLADCLTKREEFDQRLNALDKAISLQPHGWAARDEKARVLALAGRFEESLNTCRNGTNGTPPAPELGVREAWVLSQKGDLDGAIARMNAALERDSANVWGWELLSDWHEERSEHAKAEEAVRHIARLKPNDPVPHGYIADLRMKQGDRAGAIRSLARSIEISPGYRFGGFTLFRLHMEDRRHDDAGKVLEAIRGHVGNLNAWARDFALGSRRLTPEPAFAALRAMLDSPEDEPSAFDLVVEELKQRPAPWLERATSLCGESFRNASCNPRAGAFYVQLCHTRTRQPKPALLDLLPPEGAAVQHAYRQWFDALGERGWQDFANGRTFRSWLGRWRVKRLIRKHGGWLRKHTEMWGIVSYATHSLRMSKTTVAWLADWRDRPDAQAWMLNNLVLALQETGGRPEMEAVVRHVLTLPEHSQMTMRFHLWAAIEAALNEREAEARRLLDGVDPRRLEAHDKKLHGFLQVLLRYQPGAQPSPKLDAAARVDLTAFLHKNERSKLKVEDFKRACRLISRRMRSPWIRLWGWREVRPTLFAVIIAVLAIAGYGSVSHWLESLPAGR